MVSIDVDNGVLFKKLLVISRLAVGLYEHLSSRLKGNILKKKLCSIYFDLLYKKLKAKRFNGKLVERLQSVSFCSKYFSPFTAGCFVKTILLLDYTTPKRSSCIVRNQRYFSGILEGQPSHIAYFHMSSCPNSFILLLPLVSFINRNNKRSSCSYYTSPSPLPPLSRVPRLEQSTKLTRFCTCRAARCAPKKCIAYQVNCNK